MKLLLGLVGSDTDRALDRTLDRVRVTGDDLTIVIAANDEELVEEIDRKVEQALEEIDLDVTVRHVEGDSGGQLVEIAETEGFDRIVLGGGQTSPMGKIKIGSTAEFVLLNSHTSVTLIR